LYLLLLAIQVVGSFVLVWTSLPGFGELARNPGQQPSHTPYDSNAVLIVLAVMQGAYWYRFFRVEIPFRGPNPILAHLFLFLGRLNFIFATTFYSVVVFRHLPELSSDTDQLLMFRRGVLLVCSLFALFCVTLEVERLGNRAK
jgi:hypothetical protein